MGHSAQALWLHRALQPMALHGTAGEVHGPPCSTYISRKNTSGSNCVAGHRCMCDPASGRMTTGIAKGPELQRDSRKQPNRRSDQWDSIHMAATEILLATAREHHLPWGYRKYSLEWPKKGTDFEKSSCPCGYREKSQVPPSKREGQHEQLLMLSATENCP